MKALLQVAALGLAVALAPSTSNAAEIRVLSTRSMNHVLTELAQAFEPATGHKIALVLAPPNEIRTKSRPARASTW